MLLVTILLFSIFAGCAKDRGIELSPLESDFFFVKKGETINAPKDGAFASSEYLSEILEVHKEEVK
jgi:hypothetical protein